MPEIALTSESLFGPLARRVPAGPPTTLILVSAFPEALSGPKPSRSFVASVRRFGVVAPVIVREDADGRVEFRAGRYSLVDGNRRVMAAREVGLERVPARVLPALDDTAALTLALNGSRADNPVTEYLAIKSFVARGLTESEISRATGYPAAKIRARLVLDGLHEALFAALAEQRITAAVAEAAARIGPEPQAQLVTKLEESGRLTAGDVRDVRQVEVATALAALPFDLFESTEAETGAWRAVVRADLERALATVPADGTSDARARDVARAIRRALALLTDEPDDAAAGATAA
jgi:ParB/RepB/Spo0J family partition protein